VELLHAAFGQMPAILLFTVVAVTAFAILLWRFFPPNIATLWVAAMLLLTALRAGIWLAFKRAQQTDVNLRLWQRIFTAQSGVGGLAWGIGSAAMVPSTGGAELALLVGGMLCVTAVSVSSLASQQSSLRLFAAGVLVPLAIAVWMKGGDAEHMVALILLTGLCVTMFVGRRSNVALRGLLASQIQAGYNDAYRAVRESEERYRTLVEWSPEPMCVNRDGIVVYVNPATVTMFGAQSAHELLGRPMIEFVHPRYREFALARRAQVESGGAQVVPMVEMEFIKLDGTTFQCESQGLAVMFDGKPSIQVAMRDISARKAAEAALARSQERLQELVAGSGVGLWEWDFASDELYLSPQWKRHLGYEDAELPSGGDTVRSRVHPDDWERMNQAVLDFRAGLRQSYREEFRMRHRDGDWRWVYSQASIIHDATGNALRMVGSHVDITNRRRDELALRESEVRLRLALRGADLGLWDWDAPTGQLTVNERWMTMLGLDANGPKPSIDDWHARVHPDDMPTLEALMLRLTNEFEFTDFEAEIRARHEDGRYRWILDKGAIASRAADGKPLRIVGTHMDITERKEAELTRLSLEAQLRESQKMQAIGTLAGGVAHDFNNIIAAILGNTELARQDATDAAVLESLKEIQRAGTRGRDLVQQILSFSRRQPIEKQQVSLSAVIDESVRLLRATMPARLSVIAECAADLPVLLADATQLQQVVVNLASNAMQAIPNGPGRIEIRAESVVLSPQMAAAPSVNGALRSLYAKAPSRVVRLVVSDNGAGMDAATQSRIFEPFFTTKPVNEGTGLGLSVVHGIVESHEGAIVVVSEPGMGTTFTVYLPVLSSPLPSRASPSVSTDAAPLTSPQGHVPASPASAIDKHPAASAKVDKKILYLDDDESIIFLVDRLLTRRGFTVDAFSQQQEALAALAAAPNAYGLVVTDYNMPGMSGLDIAVKVKALRADLPVAIASGFVDEALREKAAAVGVRELIFKANVVDDFCAAISRLVERD
jgi:PAS domain S-box-containing protein